MAYIPCRKRVFTIKLANAVTGCYETYLHWQKILLRRLGKECMLKVWENAYKDYDETFLKEILSTGWTGVPGKETVDTEFIIKRLISQKFFSPVENVSGDFARELIEKTPPIYLIGQLFPSLDMQRNITTYEALHLLEDGISLLTESLIDLHGKEGELLAYDIMMAKILEKNTQQASAYQFMTNYLKGFTTEPEEANIYSAGVEVKIIKKSKIEVKTHVIECEFARYYRDHHPRIGYMMACSLDHASYSSVNKNIWLRRTSTLMEGGKVCNFRVYAARDVPGVQ